MQERAQHQHEPPTYVKAARFDWLTPVYDLLVVALARERRWKPALVDQIELECGMRVLDLGCGTGTLALAIARAEPGATVVGLDGDPQILARARRKAAEANVDITFVHGLAQDPPLPPESFDAVVSSLLFHHLRPEAKDLALAKANGLLRPGGRIHIADWGRPQDPLMRLLSLSVRPLGGFGAASLPLRRSSLLLRSARRRGRADWNPRFAPGERAHARPPKLQKQAKLVAIGATGCPSEASAKAPEIGAFSSAGLAPVERAVWSRLWSFPTATDESGASPGVLPMTRREDGRRP